MLHNFSWVIPNKLSGSNLPGGSIVNDKFSVLELTKDLLELKEKEIDVIASVIEELPQGFKENCVTAGFEHLWFPVEDYQVPTDIDEYRTFINKILNRIAEGKKVNIHCKMGIGRTGTTLSCVIGSLNKLNSENAIKYVRKIRPSSVENIRQISFIQKFLDNQYPPLIRGVLE